MKAKPPTSLSYRIWNQYRKTNPHKWKYSK